jgi:hypothetical protein
MNIHIPVLNLVPIYGIFAVGLFLCAYLFFSLKREIRQMEQRWKRKHVLLQEGYDRVESGVAGLQAARVAELPTAPRHAAPPVAPAVVARPAAAKVSVPAPAMICEQADPVAAAQNEFVVSNIPSPAIASDMNLNKRIQAVRMHRRGDRPEQIAAALSLPKNEVALLLKVHEVVGLAS